jgi:hypothetical protein
MSLISVRRKRKKEWVDYKKGASLWRLAVGLVVVIGVIWYLGQRF